MKIFDDKELKTEIQNIDFGTVEAGTTKVKTIHLYNESSAILTDIQVFFPSALPEPGRLVVLKAPKTIQPKKNAELVISWSPSLNFKQALEIPISIKGTEIYLAKELVPK